VSETTVSLPPPESREGHGEGWNLAAIVASLRGIREHSQLEWRQPHSLVQLPSRKALGQALEGLSASLYPHRLGLPEPDLFGFPTPLSATDYFVGHTLDASLRSLRDQIRIELAAREPPRRADRQMLDLETRATAIVAGFATQLPSIRTLLDTDLQAAFYGDPAAGSIDEVLVCYPGVKAITYHRFAHVLYGLGCPVVARIIAEISHSATGVDIHPGAEIGESFFIDHGSGVVIGGTAVIGNRVRLYQAVTLGARHFPVDDHGRVVKGEPRHPIVEDDVVIYAGATILGRVTIGRGSTIGGNVWLTRSIPAGTTITQARARNETFNDGAGI
jgi:serine O-acetyltransferase